MASVEAIRSRDGKNITSYRFRAYLGKDASGKTKFATKTVKPPEGLTPKKMEKELQRQADTWEQALRAGIIPVEKTSFKAFSQLWFSTRIDNGKSAQNTVSYYKNLLPRVQAQFGDQDITKIKPMDVERFFNSLSAQKNTKGEPLYSQATLHHFYRILNAIFSYAELNDLVPKNIMRKVQVPKNPKRALKENEDFLTIDEAKRFLKELYDVPLQWRCMMMLFVTTGIRRGEACGLIWQDINFQEATLSISRNVTYSKEQGIKVGPTKTENSVRTLPLSASMVTLLRLWKREQSKLNPLLPSAFVFANIDDPYQPMFPTSPTRWLHTFTKKHGLPSVSPHDLRHTCGSLMLTSGASVKEVQNTLGHADASTTLNFYVGTDQKALEQASKKLAMALGM